MEADGKNGRSFVRIRRGPRDRCPRVCDAGAMMVAGEPWIGIPALVLLVGGPRLLHRLPAAPLVLIAAMAIALATGRTMVPELPGIAFYLPDLLLPQGWSSVWQAFELAVLPQMPLTVTNAVIASVRAPALHSSCLGACCSCSRSDSRAVRAPCSEPFLRARSERCCWSPEQTSRCPGGSSMRARVPPGHRRHGRCHRDPQPGRRPFRGVGFPRGATQDALFRLKLRIFTFVR